MITSRTRLLHLITLVLGALSSPCGLRADEALFIGNSFTYGGPVNVIREHGGVPKLVEAIAAAKERKISTLMLAVGGKDWGYLLQQPKTEEDLNVKNWDWVVLQDYSSSPTHIGKPDDFFKNGETFYRRIMRHSPKARIVLYETWARPKGSAFYTGASTPKTFVDVAQMNGELQKNYNDLYRRLEAIDPGPQVELAPVGLAFERCVEKYPDINLYAPDMHHASVEGSYLAALVLYATICQDSPTGATREFFGASLDAGVAAKLQQIADEVGHSKMPTPAP